MGLLERVAQAQGVEKRFDELTVDDYFQLFNYAGNNYLAGLNTTYGNQRLQEVTHSLPAYYSALLTSPPAFAAQMVRGMVLSQARFVFRRRAGSGAPRKTFTTTALAQLQAPWRGATTGELLSRMEWHAGLAGNAFVYRQQTRLRVLRPDWTAIIYGSELEPDNPAHAVDGEVIGYVYRNGGYGYGGGDPWVLLPEDVAHWSPIPDPLSPGLGMSWVTPAIRDIQADRAATEHKLKYFQNGATPNLVVKGIPAENQEMFDRIVDKLEERHAGVRNAYRTLYLTTGADATVIGSNLSDAKLKEIQASGETRLSVLSRVPAPLLGISEGLSGSSLNSGNFGMARRMFADTWVYPGLQDLCAALAPIVKVPGDSELWFDTSDMPLLREDGKDAAEIQSTESQVIRTLIDAGYEAESVVKALRAKDWALLVHSGLFSVQLQAPGANTPPLPPLPALAQE